MKYLFKSFNNYLKFFFEMVKKKVSATIDDNLIKWIDSQVKKKKFANRSHGLEFCLQQVKNRTK